VIAWCGGEPADAQITSTATTGVSANWTALSWDNGVPGGQAGDVANANSSASVTITIDQPLTLRTLNHTQSAAANVIFNASGGSTVTFDSGQVGTNASLFFTRSNGDSLAMKLNAPIVLNSTLDAAWGRVQNREMGFGGVISGVGGLNVNYASVALNGGGHIFRFGDQSTASPNTYSGGTSLTTRNSTFSTVKFQAYKAGAFGTGPLTLATAALDLREFDQTIGGLGGGVGASKISSLSNTAGTTTLTIDFADSAGPFTFSGAIQAGGSARIVAVTKQGGGTQSLSGTNTYTGPTSVLGGVLAIASTGSIDTTSGVTVNGANAVFRYDGGTPLLAPLTLTQGTLTGTGTIASAVVAGSGARLSPGNSPGVQAFTNGLQLAGQGSYLWEIGNAAGTSGTGWDLIDVTGGVLDLSGLDSGAVSTKYALDLMTLDGGSAGPMAGYDPAQASAFQVFRTAAGGVLLPGSVTAVGGEDVTGLFSLGTNGWANTLPSGGFEMRVSAGGTGIDLVSVVAVPEPASLGAAAGVLAALGLLFHRRRRSARS
jgi:MYXO-CTERM domain-containing protein